MPAHGSDVGVGVALLLDSLGPIYKYTLRTPTLTRIPTLSHRIEFVGLL
jgi:hypothetical protein